MKTQVIKIDQNTVEVDGEVYVKKDDKTASKGMPKLGEVYYYIRNQGYICSDDWDGYNCEKEMYQQGNVFRTEEEAIHERERRSLMTDLRKFSDFDPDWEDDNQLKYSLWFDQKRCVALGYTYFLPNQVYFSSKEKAEQAIEKFSDRLKYLLPYKE